MILSYSDIKVIQKLGYDQQHFVTDQDGWLQLKNRNGRCIFHDGTYCTIYPYRPKGCTLYPVVYDKDNSCAILDHECPQQYCFHLSTVKTKKLQNLIFQLEKERTERKNNIRRYIV